MTDKLEVGMKLHAKYPKDGEYYPAIIAAVSDSKKRAKAPVKVNFVGYEEDGSWLALADLKSKKIPKSVTNGSKDTKTKGKPKAKANGKEKNGKPKKFPKIKLTYFDIEGVAEKIRLALTLGGIEFEDDRVSREKWAEMKADPKYAKFGQIPMMTIGDGEPFAQSGAMLRYCGRMARLSPPSKLLKIEEVIGLEEDLAKAIAPSLYMGIKPWIYGWPEDMPKDQQTKVQLDLRKKLVAPGGDIPRMLGYFQDFLSDDSPFMAGKTVSIADCQVIPRLRSLTSGRYDGIPTDIVDGFPKLKAYYDRFHEIPAIAAWYKK